MAVCMLGYCCSRQKVPVCQHHGCNCIDIRIATTLASYLPTAQKAPATSRGSRPKAKGTGQTCKKRQAQLSCKGKGNRHRHRHQQIHQQRQCKGRGNCEGKGRGTSRYRTEPAGLDCCIPEPWARCHPEAQEHPHLPAPAPPVLHPEDCWWRGAALWHCLLEPPRRPASMPACEHYSLE